MWVGATWLDRIEEHYKFLTTSGWRSHGLVNKRTWLTFEIGEPASKRHAAGLGRQHLLCLRLPHFDASYPACGTGRVGPRGRARTEVVLVNALVSGPPTRGCHGTIGSVTHDVTACRRVVHRQQDRHRSGVSSAHTPQELALLAGSLPRGLQRHLAGHITYRNPTAPSCQSYGLVWGELQASDICRWTGAGNFSAGNGQSHAIQVHLELHGPRGDIALHNIRVRDIVGRYSSRAEVYDQTGALTTPRSRVQRVRGGGGPGLQRPRVVDAWARPEIALWRITVF